MLYLLGYLFGGLLGLFSEDGADQVCRDGFTKDALADAVDCPPAYACVLSQLLIGELVSLLDFVEYVADL